MLALLLVNWTGLGVIGAFFTGFGLFTVVLVLAAGAINDDDEPDGLEEV